MRKEIIEYTKKWIEKAEKDFLAAETLYREGIYEYSIYHSQQAVEKYLKAFLTYFNKPFGKTHNIIKLIEMCKEIDKDFDKLLNLDIHFLFPLGLIVRYPEFDIEIKEEDAKEALDIARKVREFILNKLNIE